jgi:predicted DNA-binding transcriptional regulator AlpA
MNIQEYAMKQKPASSVNEFCADHSMGRTMFYDLLKKGKGPEIIKLGRRTIISVEAAKRWREKLSKEYKDE